MFSVSVVIGHNNISSTCRHVLLHVCMTWCIKYEDHCHLTSPFVVSESGDQIPIQNRQKAPFWEFRKHVEVWPIQVKPLAHEWS